MSFGAHLREQWLLDRNLHFLNHGSFGATPIAVLQAQNDLRTELERNPVQFLYGDHPQRVRGAADRLATFLGARGDDLVFVDNATTGVMSVLQSITLDPDDEVVALSHGYPAVHNAIRYVCSRTRAHLVIAEVPFPIQTPEQVIEAVEAALSPNTRLAILDWISSASGLVMPIQRLVELCHQRGVPVLVDGAHAPGQVPVHLEELDADWVTGNCHKWLFAPKGAAFLWARNDRQFIHPVVISHGYGKGFTDEFDYVGTRDITPWLSVPAALDVLEGFDAARVRRHNHALVNEAADKIAATWETERPAPRSMTAAMVTLQPPASAVEGTREACNALHDRLLAEYGVEVPIFPHGGRGWVRISAQIYNELDDYAPLAEALRP